MPNLPIRSQTNASNNTAWSLALSLKLSLDQLCISEKFRQQNYLVRIRKRAQLTLKKEHLLSKEILQSWFDPISVITTFRDSTFKTSTWRWSMSDEWSTLQPCQSYRCVPKLSLKKGRKSWIREPRRRTSCSFLPPSSRCAKHWLGFQIHPRSANKKLKAQKSPHNGSQYGSICC